MPVFRSLGNRFRQHFRREPRSKYLALRSKLKHFVICRMNHELLYFSEVDACDLRGYFSSLIILTLQVFDWDVIISHPFILQDQDIIGISKRRHIILAAAYDA